MKKITRQLIAQRIKQARQEEDLSIYALSAMTHIPYSAIVGYENNRAMPGIDKMALIAEATNRSLDWFVADSHETKEENREAKGNV